MARWEPDAEDRLRRAAVALFVERGYDAVTVADIAERAGLTRRSFFRYFPDKREVLFAGSSRLPQEVEQRLDGAAPEEPTQNALMRILTEAGAVLVHDRARQQQRQTIIASSPELQERDRTKIAHVSAAIGRSLARRGLADTDAQLLGAIYADAFRFAYDQTLTDNQKRDFATHLGQALGVIGTFFHAAADRNIREQGLAEQ